MNGIWMVNGEVFVAKDEATIAAVVVAGFFHRRSANLPLTLVLVRRWCVCCIRSA